MNAWNKFWYFVAMQIPKYYIGKLITVPSLKKIVYKWELWQIEYAVEKCGLEISNADIIALYQIEAIHRADEDVLHYLNGLLPSEWKYDE